MFISRNAISWDKNIFLNIACPVSATVAALCLTISLFSFSDCRLPSGFDKFIIFYGLQFGFKNFILRSLLSDFNDSMLFLFCFFT